MIKRTLATAAVLLAAVVGLTAQNKSAGINLSLWKNISTQPADSTQTTYFNVGFASVMNRLNGVGVNLLAGTTLRDMNGVQVAGIANAVGGSMRGIQVAGITNVNGDNMSGVALSGLVNIAGNRANGILVTGLTNIVGNQSCGLMISGITNIAGEGASGVHIAGLANIAGRSLNGVMLGGLLNVTGESVKGVQVSALGNVTGNHLSGMQVGLLNFANKADGVQIGLVNFYNEGMKGFQLGLVNANPDTQIQLMLYGGNSTKLNAGVRFKNQLFYTIVGVGGYFLDFDDKFSGALSYRAGLELPLIDKLFVSGDLGYQHIETFKNKDYGYPKRLYALQARVNLEYRFTERLGLFATGGYSKSWDYSGNGFKKGMIWEVGTAISLSKVKSK